MRPSTTARAREGDIAKSKWARCRSLVVVEKRNGTIMLYKFGPRGN